MSIPRRTLLQAGALSALGLGPVAHAATEAPRTFQPGTGQAKVPEIKKDRDCDQKQRSKISRYAGGE